ncbi:MAG TPA: HEAT repeat domain-containing protein, partial [Puia sp.]|nr:HEAT repeat domain-containing protein [Puia sp.]
MRKFFTLFFLITGLSGTRIFAQTDSSTLPGQITDLLSRMPAPNQQQSDGNMQIMASLGEPGLQQMISMLSPAGTGDNTKLQYALSAYAYYASRPGNDSLKSPCAEAYGAGLDKTIDKENKAFIIRQLQVVGGDQTVNRLKPYLTDERLCDPAARALVKINTNEAKQALLESVSKVLGERQLTLVEALGDSRYEPAVASLTPMASSENKLLRKLALYALARIGDPASETVLSTAAAQAGYRYDETGATQAYLDYAARLRYKGNTAEAVKIADTLLQNAKQDDQVAVRTAALKLLTEAEGPGSVPLLIEAGRDPNAQYRAAAFQLARQFRDDKSTGLWVDQLTKTLDTSKAPVLDLLGTLGNKSALPALLNELKSKDESVRLAAIRASARVGGQDALPTLLDVMKKGGSPEIAEVSSALATMKGSDLTRTVANSLSDIPPAAQVALLNLLAARSADSRLYDVMPLLKSPDSAVSQAAFASLKKLVHAENLPLLVNMLVNSTDSTQIKSLQEAIVAASSGIQNKNRQVSIIIAEMNKNPARESLFYPVLAGMCSTRSLALLMGRYDNGDESAKRLIAG